MGKLWAGSGRLIRWKTPESDFHKWRSGRAGARAPGGSTSARCSSAASQVDFLRIMANDNYAIWSLFSTDTADSTPALISHSSRVVRMSAGQKSRERPRCNGSPTWRTPSTMRPWPDNSTQQHGASPLESVLHREQAWAPASWFHRYCNTLRGAVAHHGWMNRPCGSRGRRHKFKS